MFVRLEDDFLFHRKFDKIMSIFNNFKIIEKMFVAREIDISEKDRWHDFLIRSSLCDYRQSLEWGEARQILGWHPIRLLVEHDGEIVAIAQIFKKKLPLANLSFFYAPRGPVLDYENSALLDFLFKEIKNHARRHRAVFFRFDPAIGAENSAKIMQQLDRFPLSAMDDRARIRSTQREIFQVDLSKGEEEILRGFRRKARQHINKSVKKNLVIEASDTREGFDIFYDLMKQLEKDKGVTVAGRDYFRRVLEAFIGNKQGMLLLAKHEGTVIAGRFAISMGGTAWEIFASSLPAYEKFYPNTRLVWELMRWSKKEGKKKYNLGGGPTPGIKNFKLGFGSETVRFIPCLDLVLNRPAYFFWNILEPHIVSVFKKRASRLNKRSISPQKMV
jgi:lipid II:glycine glycyltransferase (peptidoglycan interpeptide bridge formation enzyme)